jgi:glyoxylase-like metal-dependent hydrolase (beta-lactamase superfamily II)
VIFRQVIHDDLGCASYLIGDDEAGVAAVVDPKLDIEEYLALARYMGVRIEHILETHNHADHVSGHGRLAAATGATIHIHRDAHPDYDHQPFDDGFEPSSAVSGFGRCTHPATAPSTPPSRSSTPPAGPSRGRCSPATRSSSATSRARTSSAFLGGPPAS